MVGIRDAQVLKPKPEIKKKIVTIMRVLPGDDDFSALFVLESFVRESCMSF
jgi:hypothetical protein